MTTSVVKTFLERVKDSILPRPEGAPLRVLIVDDEESIRRYVERVLRQAGYRTMTAADATEAMFLVSSEGPFDLLLTDLMMPAVTGEQLARLLRVNQPDLPVLYFTGFSDELFKERTMLGDGEAFLDKPCTPKGLVEAVELLRPAAGTVAAWSRV